MNVTASEFAKNPSKYIKQAASGLSVVITIHEVQTVKLVPVEETASQQLARLRKLPGVRAGNGKSFVPLPAKMAQGPSIVELLAEERR
jgi:antitoxin (DNA-binding transcriptional repressor) of toxin-antitoxin stability system